MTKLTDQLTDKVVSSVVKSGVRDEILNALLKSVEGNVRDAVTEVLLVVQGHATMERDKEWVKQLAGEWSPKSGLRTATTPAEVEAEIRAWMAARLAETRAAAYEVGFKEAFPIGVERGTRFGFGAREAGYTGLEEVLKAAKTSIKST